MKTKKIFKIFTIITMLMLAIFTTGCESQQDKYIKASNELGSYQKQFLETTLNKLDNAKKLNNLEEQIKIVEDTIKSLDTYQKTTKEKLENLQKIAKGNSELEKDVRLKWEEFNQKEKEFVIIKNNLTEELNIEKEKLKRLKK
ncbi:MAG: hypothetical protein IJ727_04690 [Treponema sp.]|nr:hypothetical protein [Treponema sp.]